MNEPRHPAQSAPNPPSGTILRNGVPVPVSDLPLRGLIPSDWPTCPKNTPAPAVPATTEK